MNMDSAMKTNNKVTCSIEIFPNKYSEVSVELEMKIVFISGLVKYDFSAK